MLDLHDRLNDRKLIIAADGGAKRLPWPLKRRHLADLLGLLGTHVTRSMADLLAVRLAEVEEDILILRDRARITKLCEYAPTNGDVRWGLL